jgi:hypothetical protein
MCSIPLSTDRRAMLASAVTISNLEERRCKVRVLRDGESVSELRGEIAKPSPQGLKPSEIAQHMSELKLRPPVPAEEKSAGTMYRAPTGIEKYDARPPDPVGINSGTALHVNTKTRSGSLTAFRDDNPSSGCQLCFRNSPLVPVREL